MSDAKQRFKSYKRTLIQLVGRGPMDEDVIEQIGKAAFSEHWAGVYASDEVAPLLRMRGKFAIVNTSTSKGPGSHWLGLYMSPKRVAYVYDSFGRSPARVAWRLAHTAADQRVRLVGTEPTPEQRGYSALCGQISLAWLLTVRDVGVRATSSVV